MKSWTYYGAFFVIATAFHAWLLLPNLGSHPEKTIAHVDREFHVSIRHAPPPVLPEVPKLEPEKKIPPPKPMPEPEVIAQLPKPKVELPPPPEPAPKVELPEPPPPAPKTELPAPPPPAPPPEPSPVAKAEPPPPPPPPKEEPAPTKALPEKYQETPKDPPKAEKPEPPVYDLPPVAKVESKGDGKPKGDPKPALSDLPAKVDEKIGPPAAKEGPNPGPPPGEPFDSAQGKPTHPGTIRVGAPQPPAGSGVTTIQDYRKFLAKELPRDADYTYVPKIRFGDSSAAENREIMRYFGMELIAYPESQKFYVYIDPETGLYSKSAEFDYMKNFSNRVIYRSSAYFDGLRHEAEKKFGLEKDSLSVAQLLKPASAAYFAWKEVETAKREGLDPNKVDACNATFAKTPFGAWIVKIDSLVLRDGTVKPVKDFEWTQLTGGGK